MHVEDFLSLSYSYLQFGLRWNMITCGKTRPVQDLTEDAVQFMRSNSQQQSNSSSGASTSVAAASGSVAASTSMKPRSLDL